MISLFKRKKPRLPVKLNSSVTIYMDEFSHYSDKLFFSIPDRKKFSISAISTFEINMFGIQYCRAYFLENDGSSRFFAQFHSIDKFKTIESVVLFEVIGLLESGFNEWLDYNDGHIGNKIFSINGVDYKRVWKSDNPNKVQPILVVETFYKENKKWDVYNDMMLYGRIVDYDNDIIEQCLISAITNEFSDDVDKVVVAVGMHIDQYAIYLE